MGPRARRSLRSISTASWKMNKGGFYYYNRNPWQADEEDCVCRAISAALDISYVAVDRLLDLTAYAYGCEKLCVCCYHHLLEDVFAMEPADGRGLTVGEIAEEHPGRKLLIRCDGHLTCSMYGVVIDTWDCTDEVVDCYWIV